MLFCLTALVVDEHNAADILKSPMVGTAYLRACRRPPFVEIGAQCQGRRQAAADRSHEDLQ